MSNIIDRALGELKGNWTQGAGSTEGPKCVMAHLIDNSDYAMQDYPLAAGVLREIVLEQYLDRTDTIHHPVVAFNDHPDTTEDDVIAVMEKATIKYNEIYGA